MEDDERQPEPEAVERDPGATPPSWRKSRRKALRVVLIASAVAIALVVAGTVTVSTLNQERTAQATAQAYFEALAAGDASAAHALTYSDAFESRDTTFLTDEMLESATELISDVEAVPGNDSLDTFDQRVDVSYTLAGERHTVELTLRRGEPEWGFLKTFELPRPFAKSTSIRTDGLATFTLAGHPFSYESPGPALFPAVYPVAPADPNLFELKESEVVVDGLGMGVSVTFEPTAALADQVQTQANRFMDDCARGTQTGKDDSLCPLFVYMPDADSTQGTWEILEYPTIELRAHGSSFMARGGAARFTPLGGGEPVDTYRGIEFGSLVHVVDGKVELEIAQR